MLTETITSEEAAAEPGRYDFDLADAADAVAEATADIAGAHAAIAVSDAGREVSGAAVLDEARDFISRFAVLPSPEALDAVTLWCAHTHAFRAFPVTPRLAFLSDEPASGKTRCLDLISLLTARPELCVDPTGPVVFILIKECTPTLLLDETDMIFGKGGNAGKRQVLAVLNSGYKMGATVPRARKDSVERFPVFCPVAFAGLGRLPDTLMTRSVVVRMRQRRKHETCDAYMPRMHAPLGLATGAALASWTASVLPELASAWPTVPEGVQDRAAEIWEPLLSIAEQAGGSWPARARKACEALVLGAGGKPVRAPSLQLLDDIALVWPEGAREMPTAELVRLLMDVPGTERAWEPAAAPRELAAMLRPHGIAPVKIRIGERTAQGYRWADIATTLAPVHAESAAA